MTTAEQRYWFGHRVVDAPKTARGEADVSASEADDYTTKLPGSWKTTDPTVASLVVCADDPDYGTAVRTCPYTPVKNPSAFPTDVTFHKIAIPVKAYELRTGWLVARTTLQINSSSCPRTLHFTSYFDSDFYVPSKE
ncbi:hypothetical protein E0H75_19225 [Kribbella capetownensis]|uniref:Uncharacterized protein n=1 Tax=Kribbella capetownensis TaxID=1572659 RepID=A0A4R0JNB7_9ACTN|nr:hypothetical protein [Kribbella capetownensis]TCC48713.1 hypothetical protein E0H75_19225 [Kribbella capetownensis]